MRRLSSIREVRRQKDRGASAVIVAIFASTVIVGMLALTVDVGSIMYERRQVQNTADATALALAQICAKSSSDCDPSSLSTASSLTSLLNGNSADKVSQMDTGTYTNGVCGRNTGSSASPPIPTCDSANFGVVSGYTPPSVGDLAVCPALPDSLRNKPSTAYVETYTMTKTASGSSILPNFFSQALTGGSSNATVRACARAAWGPVGSTPPTMPFVLGVCNWNNATNNGTLFAPSPPYSAAPNTSPLASVPAEIQVPRITTIFGHVNGSETTVLQSKICLPDLSSPPSGGYTPGGFGWVQTCADLGAAAPPSCAGAPPCSAAFSDTGTVTASPGASPASGCTDALLSQYVGEEVYVPIITAVAGSGGNAVYTVQGISSFFVAGYKNLAGGVTDKNAYLSTDAAYRANTCDPTASSWKSACVWGWFTSPILPTGSMGSSGGSARGPIVVAAAG